MSCRRWIVVFLDRHSPLLATGVWLRESSRPPRSRKEILLQNGDSFVGLISRGTLKNRTVFLSLSLHHRRQNSHRSAMVWQGLADYCAGADCGIFAYLNIFLLAYPCQWMNQGRIIHQRIGYFVYHVFLHFRIAYRNRHTDGRGPSVQFLCLAEHEVSVDYLAFFMSIVKKADYIPCGVMLVDVFCQSQHLAAKTNNHKTSKLP